MALNPITSSRTLDHSLTTQQTHQILPLRPPPFRLILPLTKLLVKEGAVPRPQALKRTGFGQLQQSDPVISQRALQKFDLRKLGAVRGENADDLAIDLKAVEQVADVR